MADRPPIDITALLNAWTDGAPGALDQLLETVYPELHRIASRYFRQEAPSHTLQCTALKALMEDLEEARALLRKLSR